MYRHRMRWAILLLLVVLVSALAIAAVADDPQTQAQTTTLYPVADTWVGEDQPTGNFGAQRTLEVDGSAVQQAFLRFDLDGIDGAVSAATLRLYVDNPSSEQGGSIETTSDTAWDEATLNWDTRPAIDGSVIATPGSVERATWVEFDVTAGVRADVPVTFVISYAGSDGAAFAARESDTPPELVITYDSSGSTLTPVPILGGTLRSTATPGTGPVATATPTVEPVAMPGSVEAEDYRPGGEGVGYHDTSAGNNGGEYRDDDVDIQTCTDATTAATCFSIGYIRAGEWLAYDLDFAEQGQYAVSLRVANWNADRKLHLEIDGRDVSGPVIISNTGGPQTWADVQTSIIAFPAGIVTLRIVADDEGFNLNSFLVGAPVADAVLVGAGDIGDCNSDGDEQTAALLDEIDGTIFTTGDNAYPDGARKDFANCYGPTWGRHKDRTRPAVGNHEYIDRTAAGYFEYFGAAAGEPGKGYYSYDAGTWHVVVLNSNCSRAGDQAGCDPSDPQVEWLRQDLAAHPNTCTVAYWHHPRFSSGDYGDDENMAAFWEELYAAGADLVINGHEHYYERLAPLAPDGTPDDERGIRQIIVGTGGSELSIGISPQEHSEVLEIATYGVLKLTLRTSGYDWEFIPVEGSTFTDAGSGSCH